MNVDSISDYLVLKEFDRKIVILISLTLQLQILLFWQTWARFVIPSRGNTWDYMELYGFYRILISVVDFLANSKQIDMLTNISIHT